MAASIFKFGDKFGYESPFGQDKSQILDDITNEIALASPFGERSLLYTGIRSSFGSIPKND
jgi:hypothetical protein